MKPVTTEKAKPLKPSSSPGIRCRLSTRTTTIGDYSPHHRERPDHFRQNRDPDPDTPQAPWPPTGPCPMGTALSYRGPPVRPLGVHESETFKQLVQSVVLVSWAPGSPRVAQSSLGWGHLGAHGCLPGWGAWPEAMEGPGPPKLEYPGSSPRGNVMGVNAETKGMANVSLMFRDMHGHEAAGTGPTGCWLRRRT